MSPHSDRTVERPASPAAGSGSTADARGGQVHTVFGPDAGLPRDLCVGHKEMCTLVWGVMLLRTVTVSHYARMQLDRP